MNDNDDDDSSSGVGNHVKLTGYVLEILSMAPKICQNPFLGYVAAVHVYP